jgi:iron-sulfur cluster repair protein YtfE (RIC family)
MPSDNQPGAASPAGDILDLLKRDHVRVDSLLDQLEDTGDGDERRRGQLFAQMAAELEVHSDSEDQIVYAALEARPGFEEPIDGARAAHEHIEQMLEELDDLDLAAGDWLDKLRELRQLVRHHVDQEEGQLFAMVTRELGADERARLGNEFIAAKESEEDVSGERGAAVVPANGERDIEALSKRELYELARTRHVEGRSAMTKAELVHAIRAAR